MEKLPEDVLSNILIRLLAKPLARMRCVSKPWNALLTRPYFVKSHLTRSIHNNQNDGIVLYFQDNFYFNMPFLTFNCRTPCRLNTDFIVKTPVNAPSGHSIASRVIGSVNGLICFAHQSNPTSRIYIWNPSLSVLLPLPPYTIPSYSQGYDVMFRFGFDPKTDDYKVVKFTFRFKTPPTDFHLVVKEWLQVEVYSMRKGYWKFIPQRFPSHVTWIHNEDEVCVDGHDGRLHWLGYLDESLKQQTIVTFDLSAETFIEISLPVAIIDYNIHRYVLGVLEGKLCVMSYITDDNIEVWVMNENSESWAKHQLFSQFISTTTPYAFIEYNEFLFDSRYKHLALYDSIVAKVKSSNLRGIGYYKNTKLVQYVDSLVWIAPAKSLSTVATTIDCKFDNCAQQARENLSKGGPSTLRNVSLHLEEGNYEIYDDDDNDDDEDKNVLNQLKTSESKTYI